MPDKGCSACRSRDEENSLAGMDEFSNLYADQDCRAVGNVLVLRYSKLDFNRHKHGFENGVAPMIQKYRAQGVDTVLLDLEETSHVESLTLGSIIRFKKDFTALGIASIRIVNPSEMLERVFAEQNLDKVFGSLFSNRDQALKELCNSAK